MVDLKVDQFIVWEFHRLIDPCVLMSYAELIKSNGAKLRELSQNFPKLADWLYIEQEYGEGDFLTEDILAILHNPA